MICSIDINCDVTGPIQDKRYEISGVDSNCRRSVRNCNVVSVVMKISRAKIENETKNYYKVSE